MITKKIHEILYSLPHGQKITLPNELINDPMIKFVDGLPEITNKFSDGKNRLLIIDDQASEANEEVSLMFTRQSHHFNLSVILLTQNLFSSNPFFRTISLNSHYLIIFKSPRNQDQVRFLSRQIYPTKSKFFIDSYSDCCSKPYSYFLIDLTQKCEENLRLRTKIFPDDQCTIIYVFVEPKKTKKR